MTKDEIIGMAWEAGWDDHHCHFDTRIERFAELVAAAEREACAKVCEREYDNWDNERPLRICASAIRARNQQ